VVGSPNRYAEAVKWHHRQSARAEIGDDPAAYKARLEAELREQILAELGGSSGARRFAQLAPSNLAGARNVGARGGPAWSGPASLNDIFDRSRK
jgi:UDP-N-acetylglucosamine:LPS N-acetylglucosamine transferase